MVLNPNPAIGHIPEPAGHEEIEWAQSHSEGCREETNPNDFTNNQTMAIVITAYH
jgi:hypothetical protein